ncbi:MAG: hypothetical protein IJW40_06585 [Clostridia bacterium]|nr:hypothetical protein [Clostridia bacterium]
MADGELTAAQRGAYDEDEMRETPDAGMPRGLMLAVARDMHVMEVYAKMNERDRAAFLDRARNTPDGEPMQRLVRDLRYGEMNI